MTNRRSLLRFGLRRLLAAILACALLSLLLAVTLERMSLAQRLKLADRASDQLLVEEHWQHWQQIAPTTTGQGLKDRPSYLLRNDQFTDGTLPDDFERSLFSDVFTDASTSDVFARRDGMYYKVIRAKGTCYTCHKSENQVPNAPLAIMKFRLPK